LKPVRSFRVAPTRQARVRALLGPLGPDDVTVQLYWGCMDTDGEIVAAEAAPMHLVRSERKGTFAFEPRGVQCKKSGLHGYTVRVLPNHSDLASPFVSGPVTRAKPRESLKHTTE
jgi:starch phosphorylase